MVYKPQSLLTHGQCDARRLPSQLRSIIGDRRSIIIIALNYILVDWCNYGLLRSALDRVCLSARTECWLVMWDERTDGRTHKETRLFVRCVFQGRLS